MRTVLKRQHPDRVMIDGLEHVNSKVLGAMINFTEYYVRRLANTGKIPGRKMNKKWWFHPQTVIDHMRRNDTLNPTPLPNCYGSFDPAAGV